VLFVIVPLCSPWSYPSTTNLFRDQRFGVNWEQFGRDVFVVADSVPKSHYSEHSLPLWVSSCVAGSGPVNITGRGLGWPLVCAARVHVIGIAPLKAICILTIGNDQVCLGRQHLPGCAVDLLVILATYFVFGSTMRSCVFGWRCLHNRCGRCGYSMIDLPRNICPECGIEHSGALALCLRSASRRRGVRGGDR
jgi:hypothetical protein